MDWYEDWRARGSRGVSEMNDWKRKVQERDSFVGRKGRHCLGKVRIQASRLQRALQLGYADIQSTQLCCD